MSKQLSLPSSRLICVGGAKRSTNAIGGQVEEFDGGPLYDE